MTKNLMTFCIAAVALFAAVESSAQAPVRRSLLNRDRILSNRPNRTQAPAEGATAAAEPSEGAAATSEAAAGTGDGAAAQSTDPKDASAFNWDSVPVDIVLQAYSEQTDKTILKDPGAPSPTITLKTREGQKLTKDEYLEAIEIILEMNGIHLEPYGEKFIRALPRKDVRKEGIPLIMDPETKLGESGRVVSMMIPFKNIGTDEAQKALEGFKSNSGILLVFERTNSILATDTEQNINRMLEIAKAIDIATPVLENVFVRQIKNASAAEIKTALEAIVQESQKELEKNGKAVNNNAAKNNSNSSTSTLQPRPLGGRLLNTRNQPNQPQQPVNNESLVMSVSDADRGMIRGKVLILSDERSNKLIIVTQKPNMDFFDRVIEQLDVETTPDTLVKVYRLKYAEAEEVSDMINDLIGNSSSGSKSSNENKNQNAKSGTGGNLTRTTGTGTSTTQRKPSNQRTGDAKAGELTKDNTTVLADKRINGLVVMTQKDLVPTIEQIIESMDVKLSQVLIETVIIEVGLGDDLQTGMDWVKLGNQKVTTTKQRTGEHGIGMKWYKDGAGNIIAHEDVGDTYTVTKTTTSGDDDDSEETTTETVYTAIGEVMDTITTKVSGGFWSNGNTGYQLGGGGGGTGSALLSTATAIATNASEMTALNPIGGGINYFLKSDKLNLGAVIQASKSDSHSKYLASPVVMTVDNKEATIDATQMRYLFKGYQYSGSTYSGSPVPDYEQKELGIKIKVKPKINPNGTVMLTVETEYSQEGTPQTIEGASSSGSTTKFSATTTQTRKMSADVLLDNMQTVVLGGLTITEKRESESGIPFLKDIPWVGKWLFGSVTQSESRRELLIFMMPYVLDDGDAAQAEAIRRKKSLSDSRPWEDHGWSLSELADPVSKKEQLRRLKDEWKKQDEERKTKLAIEEEKVKRAKALEKMSEEERKFWLEMHKEELEKEQREELEAKMLDKESQDELHKLADEIRARKLQEAGEAIKKADEEARTENERGRLEKEMADKANAEIEPEPPKAGESEEPQPEAVKEDAKPVAEE